jgi:hypothetical protein
MYGAAFGFYSMFGPAGSINAIIVYAIKYADKYRCDTNIKDDFPQRQL